VKNEYNLTQTGAQRLATEIFRQATYDWGNEGLKEEVNTFFSSEWASVLASPFGLNPCDAQKRLLSNAINPKDFRAEYRSKRVESS